MASHELDRSSQVDHYNVARNKLDIAIHELEDGLSKNFPNDALEKLRDNLDAVGDEVRMLDAKIRLGELDEDPALAKQRARAKFRTVPSSEGGGSYIQARESDMYERGSRSFFADLYAAQVREDVSARQRIEKHHAHEVEKRALTSSTLSGIIPPAYLVELYAKASRNGRVFADQCNQQELPDVGMSLIVPRPTQGAAAGFQATENTTVSTQDPTETDLIVNVRTIAGYLPVSRQALERAAYSDQTCSRISSPATGRSSTRPRATAPAARARSSAC